MLNFFQNTSTPNLRIAISIFNDDDDDDDDDNNKAF